MYNIKDLEKLSGIKAHTLRMWEKRYGLLEPYRTETNIRYYNDKQLVRLLNVKTLISNKWKISKISQLEDEELKNEVLKVSVVYTEKQFEGQINELVCCTLSYDEKGFRKLLDTAIAELGIKRMVLDIIYPYLYRVGVMWRVENIIPAQEHFASNLIRQKLCSAIEELKLNDESDKSFLLFLPEYEYHELSLLLCQYVLRSQGYKTHYFGANVPFNNILDGGKKTGADHLFLFIIAPRDPSEVMRYLTKLNDQFSGKKIYIAGQFIKKIKDELPDKMIYLDSVDELEEELARVY